MSDTFNVLTVDLEEWFVVEALTGKHGKQEWENLPSTLEKNTRRLLDLFRRKRVTATFFVLGWFAERHQDLVAEIYNQGHEIACHSYYHRRVDLMDPDEFREDTMRSVDAIMMACGVRPRGYRAPSWSINDRIPWAFEILAQLGFDYDSSIFPIKHDIYGMPKGPRHLFRMKFENDLTLYEIPASTYRMLGRNIPVAGGGYLRHCPYWYTRRIIRRLNSEGQPAVVYIHPWEIDPDPPRVEGLSAVQKLRSYGSTELLGYKLERLLTDFQFTNLSHYIQQARQRPIGFR